MTSTSLGAVPDTPPAAIAPPLERRPFYWMLAIVFVMLLLIAAFQFAGRERGHNTRLWQHFHPVTLTSPPQTATPVEVVDNRRFSQTAVQTEKGVYFLGGVRHVPAAGSRVVVQTNARWDLFLCAGDGGACMSIHSFCADAVWPHIKRDEQGRAEGCYAPYLGAPQDAAAIAQAAEPPLAAIPGGMSKRKPPPPPLGITHPAEWAWRMGLPVSRP